MNDKKLLALTPTALTVAIVLGRAEPYDRFHYAYRGAKKSVGSQRALAAALGVHPSALARSNFTLTPARRRQAATLCGVPTAFLQDRYVVPRDLPKEFLPLHLLIKDIRHLVKKSGLTGLSGWSIEARIVALNPTDVTQALPQWPSQQVEDILLLLQAFARQSLEQMVKGQFSASDWLMMVESLVHHSLEIAPGNLHNRQLLLAKNIQRLLSQEKAQDISSETHSS